ncbi:MAG: insulinase family protein [Eubacterium sp.]|nr:insulinase family protein [Eubacterium sp.]
MVKFPDCYEVIRQERIEDVHADGFLLKHVKSGARVVLLLNDDENKVFNIAFRTPPADSTGVAHIIEHSVLCGSRKFPLKDPFVELAKGSLNTFLNAMTYPDKTMYPVASCNDADFQNLTDVYLDAVFNPNIYREEKIFRQEGWHYHLENAADPLTYNGVVFNEMKGAFSNSDEVLERAVFNALFPDTAYGVESGGDPEKIPDLTYEAFLDFHKRYYHPSNSYIYFYGNLDPQEKLAWLDEAYLGRFEAMEVDSALRVQEPFPEAAQLEMDYPVLDGEPLEDNTYLSWSAVVSHADNVEQNLAFAVLEYVLLSAPGAPVKQALLDAGIGRDVDGSFDDGILQPFFSVTARQANAEQKEAFVQMIHDTLLQIAEQGIDEKALASGINFFEFRFREADYAAYPKGLIYGIDLFDSWLYDDNEPFAYLKQLAVFASLKEKIGSGYFEELIRRYLLENPHGAVVVLRPKYGLAQAREEETAGRLAAYKESLTAEEIQGLVDETRALKAFQEAEDDEETVQCLPQLARTDIARQTPVRLSCLESAVDGTKLLQHDFFTNGIGYLTLLFDTSRVPDGLIPYTGLLSAVLGYVSTEHYTYGQLFHEINANSGGISCGLQIFPDARNEMECDRFFGIRSKYLFPKQAFVLEMIREILQSSDLDDKKRLREIIASQKARLQSSIPAAGHAAAVRRAMSYLSPMEAWQDRTTGIDYYHFIEEIDEKFDERSDEVIAKLKLLMRYLFRRENLTVSITAGTEEFECGELCDEIRALREILHTAPEETLQESAVSLGLTPETFRWIPQARNEGWKTAGQVQYVATAGNFLKAGYSYTGALRILRTILSYDYLWMNLRVKGGAYGCMAAFQRNGAAYMVSYRDPHLAETLDVYRGLPEYLAAFEADERLMTKYIIGTISDLDTPLNASAKGTVSLNSYYSGLTEEDFQREREEILDADEGAIRALAELTGVVAGCERICVIGSEAAVEKDAEVFGSVAPLN